MDIIVTILEQVSEQNISHLIRCRHVKLNVFGQRSIKSWKNREIVRWWVTCYCSVTMPVSCKQRHLHDSLNFKNKSVLQTKEVDIWHVQRLHTTRCYSTSNMTSQLTLVSDITLCVQLPVNPLSSFLIVKFINLN